jgi:protein-disulfide isomerase
MKSKIAAFGFTIAIAGLAACTPGEVALDPIEFEGMDDGPTVAGLASGVTLGDENAPITVAEFADYQCPGCAGFAGTVKPQLDLAYLQTGTAKFVFYDFPLINIHPHAFLAARAARCAQDQGMFWEYHDAIFRNQPAWSRSADAPLGLFEDYAASVGLEATQFRGCLRSDQHALTVSANLRLGELLGVGGTPTVIVSAGDGNARRLQDNSFAGIRTAVDEILAEMEAGATQGSGQ